MSNILAVFRTAVAIDLMTLAQLHDRELDEPTIRSLQASRFPEGLAFRLEETRARDVLNMLIRAVGELPTDSRGRDELAADFAAIYLNHGIGASPCESVWIDVDGLAMQEPMFEVRQAYAGRGLKVPDWRMRPDDHLVFQLQFIATLLEQSDEAALTQAAQFLDGHTLRWLPNFAERVAQRAATPFYAGLAMLSFCYLDELRDVLAQVLDEPRPTAREIEERARPVRDETLPMPSPYLPGVSPSW
jgi:TorA maturation chaperone TorD